MIEILLSIASSGIWSKVWTVAVAILFFGVIIMIHECGHFLFAKLFKVKVNEFSIGMGPAVFKRKKGETQYSVRVLPIGGYVSMEGEDQDSDDDGAFNKKPVWQKMIIVAAGTFYEPLARRYNNVHNAVNLGRLNRHQYDKILLRRSCLGAVRS